MNGECVFCRIIAGEVPSTRVYEDERTIAFLDIGPVVKGHTLVVPRQHCDPITDTPEAVLCDLIRVVRKIARAQIAGLKADGINVSQANGRVAGQLVPHIHFHVIPRFLTDGHQGNWTPRSYDSPAEMREFADRIRSALPA